MNRELAHKVADAVLYEGYMLYPYRPSAIKNRQRWTFGILYPPAYPEVADGTERSRMHTECLVEAGGETSLNLELRFLHLVARQVAQRVSDRFEPVASLMVDQKLIESWDEGVDRSVSFDLSLAGPDQSFHFSFPAIASEGTLHDYAGELAGKLTRAQHEICGAISVATEVVGQRLLKLKIEVLNETSLPAATAGRDAALLRSLLSAHTILTLSGGSFISLLDPPEQFRDVVGQCVNIGNFPVLVGNSHERDMLLCSAIVLYDYPQIAPESAGDFYDATEMDEMLTLRVMTLTDEEKQEAQLADDRVRSLLQRTEQTARDQLMRTHGTIRELRVVGGEP